jgi:hypothetical protein
VSPFKKSVPFFRCWLMRVTASAPSHQGPERTSEHRLSSNLSRRTRHLSSL